MPVHKIDPLVFTSATNFSLGVWTDSVTRHTVSATQARATLSGAARNNPVRICEAATILLQDQLDVRIPLATLPVVDIGRRLAANIGPTDTSILFDADHPTENSPLESDRRNQLFPSLTVLRIGAERMRITFVSAPNVRTAFVQRGYASTLPVSHTPPEPILNEDPDISLDPIRPDLFWDGTDLVGRSVLVQVVWNGTQPELRLSRTN